MNSWGWVDFSRKDRDLARDIVASLNVPGAVDELGIGIIRDGFADLFFPGTSTIQTNAKYFFLVAYQVEKLTKEKKDDYQKALFALENKCSRLMWDALTVEQRNNSSSGVFGSSFFNRSAREWVKRPPSEIYWSGIRKLRLFTCDNENISLYDFLHWVSMQHASELKMGHEADEIASFRDRKNYHWDLPPVADRGDWENQPTVDLTPGEAAWFIKKVTEELSETMFAFVISRRNEVAAMNDFADLGKLDLPGHLRAQWTLAQNFSDFIKAAQIRFNCLLHNENAVEKWERCCAKLPILAQNVDLDGIFDILHLRSDNPRAGALRYFLTSLRQKYLANDIDGLDREIIAREKAVKGEKRMKIGKDSNLYRDTWIGGEGLSYRFPNTKRLISDIVKAEGQFHA